MNVISIGIVGTNNEPLFLKEFADNESASALLSNWDIPEAELFGLTTTTTTTTTTPPSNSSRASVTSGTDGFSSKAKGCSLRHQFILHAALDRFEELAGPPPGLGWREPGSSGTDAMWVGLLCPVEEMRVYGYMTTTKLKIMAVVEDTVPSRQEIQARILEDDLKKLFVQIHNVYVEYTLNPFNPIDGQMIQSSRFEKHVSDCVLRFNRTV